MIGKTYYKCIVCGKLTPGRKPKNGDGTFMYPRRHGNCTGNLLEAEWIDEITLKPIKKERK